MSFEVQANVRQDEGKGASRRLRRKANKIPAIVYGGKENPLSIEIDHDKMLHALENDAFYSHILTLHIDGKVQKAILKDLQRHPYKPKIMHADFLRISKDHAIRLHVPLHFIGEEVAVGVRDGNGIISHTLNQVEVECLPDQLPEFIEVDVSSLGLGESIHLSQLPVAKGVKIVDLLGSEPHDKTVVSIHVPKKFEEPTPEDAVSAAGAEAAGDEAAADAQGDEKKD